MPPLQDHPAASCWLTAVDNLSVRWKNSSRLSVTASYNWLKSHFQFIKPLAKMPKQGYKMTEHALDRLRLDNTTDAPTESSDILTAPLNQSTLGRRDINVDEGAVKMSGFIVTLPAGFGHTHYIWLKPTKRLVNFGGRCSACSKTLRSPIITHWFCARVMAV